MGLDKGKMPIANDGGRMLPRSGQARSLLAAIEAEIIPRLVVQNNTDPDGSPLSCLSPREISPAEQEKFLSHILASRPREASLIAFGLLNRTSGIEAVFSDLLTWTARRLGTMWETDECSFTDVTVGLCHLHEILHRVSEAGRSPSLATRGQQLSAFICPMPGDQHAFGALMAAECFREEGWIVHHETPLTIGDLLSLVAQNSFDVIGLSCGKDQDKGQLGRLVQLVRAASINQSALVMLGGRFFLDHPELGYEAGADLVAADGFDAAKAARSRLARAGTDC